MYIASCDNNKCPLVKTCIRYIENHRHQGYYTNNVETYNPSVIQLSSNPPKTFNPDTGSWNPNPMCYRENNV